MFACWLVFLGVACSLLFVMSFMFIVLLLWVVAGYFALFLFLVCVSLLLGCCCCLFVLVCAIACCRLVLFVVDCCVVVVLVFIVGIRLLAACRFCCLLFDLCWSGVRLVLDYCIALRDTLL